MTKKQKKQSATITKLEKMLNSDEPQKVNIKPDGSIEVIEGVHAEIAALKERVGNLEAQLLNLPPFLKK